MYSDDSGMGFGGKSNFMAIWLDADYQIGKSNPSDTFGNSTVIASGQDFKIKSIECWGFLPLDKVRFMLKEEEKEQEDSKEDEKKVKSVLDNKDSAYVLELLGKNYSSMVHE